MKIKKTVNFIPFLLFFNTLPLFSAAPLVQSKTKRSSIITYYEHGDIVDPAVFEDQLRKEKFYKMLPVMYHEGYNRYRTPTYFFFGTTGSGKSATIFTLQGNKVELVAAASSSDEDDEDDEEEEEFELKFTKTVSIPSPFIGEDSSAGTVRSHIYYHPQKKIAFCDTEGFSGSAQMNHEEKCLSSFSPYFCLKTNPIGGIIVVLSEPNITSLQGEAFKKSVDLLKNYLSKEKMGGMKESILILITKIKSKKKILKKKLKSHIKLAYQDFYKQQEQNTKPKKNSMAGLKPFFQILLKEDVAKQDVDNTKKYVFDMRKIVFFYPDRKDSVEEAMDKILQLTPIKKEKLCKFDNPLRKYIERRVKEIGDNFNKDLKGIESRDKRIKTLEKAIQRKKGSENLQELVDDLEKAIDTLEIENKRLKEDDSLRCVFNEDHIETVPEGFETITHTIKEDLYEETLVSNSNNIFSKIGSAAGLVLSPFALATGAVYYGYAGYFSKSFTYTGREPIARIEVSYRYADFTFCNPNDQYVKDHFIEEESEEKSEEGVVNHVFTVKGRKGIKKDTWAFKHSTHRDKDAECFIKLYCKKNQHSINKEKIAHNKKGIKLSQREMESIRPLQKKIEKLQARLAAVTKEKQESEKRLREKVQLMRMFACWTQHILKENSLIATSLHGYINQFKKITRIEIDQVPKMSWEYDDEKEESK